MSRLRLPLVVPAVRLAGGEAEAEETRALRRAREPWVAGFCLFGGRAERVGPFVRRLEEAAGRPLVVASDMERGAGQQVRGLRVLPDAGIWGMAASAAEVEAFGALTAREALSVGVNVILAPVLDVRSEPSNPILGNRSFGWDADRVGALGEAFCRGVRHAGAIPVAKHYPGHGATRADSHDAVPVVEASRDLLEKRDLLPFERVLRSGACPAVMTAHVAFPSLDPRGCVATFSDRVLGRLREFPSVGRRTVVLTDALLMEGARAGIGEVEAALRALGAGCDLLLCPRDPEGLAEGLGRRLPEDAPGLEACVRRVAALLEAPVAGRESLADAGQEEWSRAAREVARRAVDLVWRGPPERRGLLVVDDDGNPEHGAVLLEQARDRGVAADLVRPEAGRGPEPDRALPGGGTVVVLASVRAWKGAPTASPACLELVHDLRAAARDRGASLRVIWCAPLPGSEGIHVLGTGPDVEWALADRLFPGDA